MKRFGIGLLCAIAGYVVAAFAGYFLIMQFSANMHDRSVEAAMTSTFVLGPAGAIIAFVIGVVRSGRRPGAVYTDKYALQRGALRARRSIQHRRQRRR